MLFNEMLPKPVVVTDEERNFFLSMADVPAGRKKIIETITFPHERNWQCVATPYDICHEMIDLIPSDADGYLVLFAMEFLEVLIKEHGVSPDKVLFVGDNEMETGIAGNPRMYGCNTIVLDKSCLTPKSCNIDILKQGVSEMKFNKLAVIGNPPYQMNDGGHSASAKPIYHLFVEAVIDQLNPDYFSMIIPSRWMVGGKGLDNHRERMMNDRRMKKIVHFPGSKSVFSTVSIAGGVNYFLWEKNHDGMCEFNVNGNARSRYLNEYDVIIQDNTAIEILEKVKVDTTNWMSQKVLSRKPFGLASNFSDWKESGVKCIAERKKEFFVDPNAFTDHSNVLGKWKVCISEANGAAQECDKNGQKRVVGDVLLLEPNTICTETYIVVNSFDRKIDAENFVSYLKTKFFRYVLGLRVVSQHINKEKFAFVPDVLDYSAPWSDEELYAKFNLTRQQITYIESKIK